MIRSCPRSGATFVAALLVLATSARAEEFTVAPDGNDSAPGTADAPFATPLRAKRAVREVIAAGLAEDVTVTFRAGTYRLAEPLRFGVQDGGTAEHSIVWRAAPGEPVSLNGGEPIKGWQIGPNGVWTVHLPDVQEGRWHFRELFFNGNRRQRARFPNGEFLRVVQAGPDRRTSLATQPNAIPPLTPGADAEIVFLHDWSISRIAVAAIESASGSIALAAPIGASAAQFAIDHFERNPRFFLENDPAYLDEPGEWHLDRASGWLGYLPRRGESIETAEVVAPVSPALVIVHGDDPDGTPVRNLHFHGLTFEHAAWSLPERGYAGIQAGFYDVRTANGGSISPGPIPAAVSFALAEDCSVVDATLRHLGGSGIEFGSRCSRCRLARSVIRDVSANGVIVGEGYTRVANGGPWWKTAPAQVATGNTVEDCLVERCGVQFFGTVGIWVGIAAETNVQRNLVRNLPYTGISLGWRWDPDPSPARDNRIAHNHIDDVMQTLTDGGGIYTLGRQPGTALVANLIHAIPAGVGRAQSNGLFLDEGTSDLTIQGNLIIGVADPPIRFNEGGGNLVRGNVITVQPGIEPFQLGNTPEASVVRQGNQVMALEQFRPIDPTNEGFGPPREVLSALLERADRGR